MLERRCLGRMDASREVMDRELYLGASESDPYEDHLVGGTLLALLSRFPR